MIKEIVSKYFIENPDARDHVMKAYYAYHVDHFRLDEKAHNFTSHLPESKCLWCDRSRELVRWDNLPGHCSKRPSNLPEPEEVIFNEEKTAFLLFEKAEKDVPKLLEKLGLNGESLAILHHTYGYDIETVSGITYISPELVKDYYTYMEIERIRSRSKQTKQIISI